MMKKTILFICISILGIFSGMAQTSPTFLPDEDPKPAGKKWVLIENLSDEFNGESLNESKWKNTDPARWMGRAPAIFKKEVAKVENGNLNLTVFKLPTPEYVNGTTWTHAGGYIGSNNAAQVGTYFEAKMKASKTFMSSTFWVINNRSDGTGCDVRVTELDIQECIGQITTSASWAQNKYREMGSNTHSRNAVCSETPEGSKGNNIDLGGAAYDDYHIYAAWWKSPGEILFFLDGKHIYTVYPVAEFNLPMYLRMVSETYDWNPVPADGGMTGSAAERTTTYDWVRAWKLEDIATGIPDSKIQNQLKIVPNPASKTISVQGITPGIYSVEIINLQGHTEKTFQTELSSQASSINISELVNGIYFLKIRNETINQTLRFVKN